MLYDLTSGSLVKVARTTFARENILERTHLQAAVRDHIDVIDPDLLVVAEEFGDFEDTHRRIYLLCLERTGRLVVVELKRTEDGGHMELQALRYAAMVSVMTFDELVATYLRHLRAQGDTEADSDGARTGLLEFLDRDDDEDEGPVISREVRIILVSADFSTEVTTTVLWLNELYGLDITCIRLSPYKHGDQVLLDVQQVIPLPEAEELTVRIRRREQAARAAVSHNRDLTKYVLTTPSGDTEPLPKRRAVLLLTRALLEAGVSGEELATAVPANRLRSVPGVLAGDELVSEFLSVHDLPPHRARRWFLDHPMHEADRTWVLSNGWGLNAEPTLEALSALAPGFGYRPSE